MVFYFRTHVVFIHIYFAFEIILDYPQLGLPPSNPYQPHEIWRLQEHNPDLLQLLTFIGDGSNIRLQGIQNARVHEIRYVQYFNYTE